MKLWPGIITEKIQESKEFYCRLFDCKPVYEAEGGWFLLLQLGESEIGFMTPSLESQAPVFRPVFQGQGVWLTVDVEDVDRQYRHFRDVGVPIEVELRDEPWGDRHFSVIDPNGIGIDIVQRI